MMLEEQKQNQAGKLFLYQYEYRWVCKCDKRFKTKGDLAKHKDEEHTY